MAKKTSGQNPVDEAYLRSLMAGVPIEPPLSSAPSTGGGNGENRETALSEEKGKADDIVNETVSGISGSDDAGCSAVTENRHRKRFARHWLTLYASSLHPTNVKADKGCI